MSVDTLFMPWSMFTDPRTLSNSPVPPVMGMSKLWSRPSLE